MISVLGPVNIPRFILCGLSGVADIGKVMTTSRSPTFYRAKGPLRCWRGTSL